MDRAHKHEKVTTGLLEVREVGKCLLVCLLLCTGWLEAGLYLGLCSMSTLHRGARGLHVWGTNHACIMLFLMTR
jgi:hypothetical protein